MRLVQSKHLIELISKLKEISDVVQIEALQGKYDVVALFLSPNPSSFNKNLKQLISDYKGLIKNRLSDMIITLILYFFYELLHL